MQGRLARTYIVRFAITALAAAFAIESHPLGAQSFSSGSTGADGDFRPLGIAGMAQARYAGVAASLATGRVLVAGGYGVTGAPMASCELFDPASGSFTPTASLSTPR